MEKRIQKLEQEFDQFARDYKADEMMWDDRARELKIYAKEDKELPVFDFLKEYMDLKGKRVLDVGFGSGKYLVPFKRAGADVYGVELSGKMVENAKAFIEEEEPGEYHLYKGPWEEVDLKERGWENYFDLVFVSKSPVMNGTANFEKLLKASRDKVFLITHITKEDSVDQEMKKLIHWEEKPKGPGVLYYIYNLLYLKGIFPDVKMVESERRNIDKASIMIQKYIHRYKNKGVSEEEIALIRKKLEELSAEDSMVLSHKSLSAYILFDVLNRGKKCL